jgi:hypothetical protein
MILASTKRGMSTLTRVKMPVEGLEPAKHRKADAAGGHRADVHALDVIGRVTHSAMCQPPFTTHWYEEM